MLKPKKLSALLACLLFPSYLPSSYALDYPRLDLWGLAGTRSLGIGDLLLPLMSNRCDSLFYTDIQGRVGSEDSWEAAAGLGYRGIANRRIFGGYVFASEDRAYDHTFHAINPGLETIGCRWDFRINGYFPIKQRKRSNVFLPPDIFDTCGNNINVGESVFRGHQQFVHGVSNFWEIGRGADAEVGYHLPGCSNASIYGGGYHYKYKDVRSINGVEGRVDVPVTSMLALTVAATYDNVQHTAIVGGIRLQLGHTPCRPMTLTNHLYDPIVRNIGTLKTGSGIPVFKGVRDEGLFLFRDNIYFFNASGGTFFTGIQSGTFENPLGPDQFSQTTVDGIAAISPNANLFFNTGTYIINPTSADAPNSRISLPGGQSLHGRTPDYRFSATGGERPTILGGLDLLVGNNTIDSIILNNSGTGNSATPLYGITAQSADNILICNSEIHSIRTVDGDLTTGSINSAVALLADNSSITIDNTVIDARAIVNGDVFGSNSAIAISATNSKIISDNSPMDALAIVSGDVDGSNTAIGLLVDNSTFVANGSPFDIQATVGGNVNGSNNATGVSATGSNVTLTDSPINVLASVAGNVNGSNTAIGLFANSSFFVANGSPFDIQATVGGDVNGSNNATGVSASDSNIALTDSPLAVLASVSGDVNASNTAMGLQLNASTVTSNSSPLDVQATVGGDLLASNSATAMSSTDSIVKLSGSPMSVLASVSGLDDGSNTARGLIVSGTTLTSTNSSLELQALVGGDVSGFNTITAISAIANSHLTLDSSPIQATASVTGGVTGINTINGFIAFDSRITSNSSPFEAQALVGADFSGINSITVGAATNSSLSFDSSAITAHASVTGDVFGTNSSLGFTANNSTVSLSSSPLDIRATATGELTGTNTATGANLTNNSTLTAQNSPINALASIGGSISGSNSSTGVSADSSSITLNSSNVTAESAVGGDVTENNSSTGLTANNSQINVTDTTILAKSIVSSILSGINSSVGIGSTVNNFNSTGSFNTNTVTLTNSSIQASSIVGGGIQSRINLNGDVLAAGNVSVGIGLATSSSPRVLLNNQFNGNHFTITNTQVAAQSVVSSGTLQDSDDLSTGIGIVGLHNEGGTSTFLNNTFALTGSQVSGLSQVVRSSASLLDAIGIGEAAGFFETQLFNNNSFSLDSTSVAANVDIQGDIFSGSGSFVNAIGVGNASFAQATSIFNTNNFTLTNNSAVSGSSSVDGNVSAPGSVLFGIAIGTSSVVAPGTSQFNGNIFTIDSTTLNSTAEVAGFLSGGSQNEAISIGMEQAGSTGSFAGNLFNCTNITSTVTAIIDGVNFGVDKALGFFAGPGTTINVVDSLVHLIGLVGGGNAPIITVSEGPGIVNLVNTQVLIN